jgi:hypothetical protein
VPGLSTPNLWKVNLDMSLGSILSHIRDSHVAKVAKEHPAQGPVITPKGTGPDAKCHLTEEGSKLLAQHKIHLPKDAAISDRMANLVEDLAAGKLDKESSRTLAALKFQQAFH